MKEMVEALTPKSEIALSQARRRHQVPEQPQLERRIPVHRYRKTDR
jgi:hypothetical protein